MSSDGKVPGIRKNDPISDDVDFLSLTDDMQRQLLNQEMMNWQRANLDVARVPHNIFNMDAMLISLVRVLTKELGISEDTLNRHYRHILYDKLTTIRKEATKTQIIVPDIKTPEI